MIQAKPRTIEDLERKYEFAKLKEIKANFENTSLGLLKIENELNKIVTTLVINLSDVLESQSDISLWFYSGIPTIENFPYTNWLNPSEHTGDIYYDKDTGYVYKFNGTIWESETNPDLIEAMALTNAETDTSVDHERKVFFNQPLVPYSNGDWWIKEDGTLFICQLSKESGIYEEGDFINSNNYTQSISEKIEEEIKVLKGTITQMSDSYAKFTDLATGGSTTIAGENIKTGNIESNNYIENVSGMKIALNIGTIDSKNFKTDTEGNVFIGTGAKIIGGDGMMTNLQFNSSNDFSRVGYDFYYVDNSYKKTPIYINAYIPRGFKIVSAFLTLYHRPFRRYKTGSTTPYWCYARNINLYKYNTLNVLDSGYWNSSKYLNDSSVLTKINNCFGNNGFTPTTPSDSNYATQNITSIDIKDHLITGMNILKLQSDAAISTISGLDEFQSADIYSGEAFCSLNIIGYMTYE